MKSRAEIQDAHELAVLSAGLSEHNRVHGLNLVVISRPDPPDAILSDGFITTWMELTDAFFSSEWAMDLSSYTSIKGHKPMKPGLYVDMDKQLAGNFCNLLEQKVDKKSYKPFVQQYGPGILVVGLESPWLDSDTIDAIDEEWLARGNPDISGTFAHVYLRFRSGSGNHAFSWPRS
ncbi:MAG TPA: hypothetical protein DHV59_17780 [Oxalobacteraceae bacterium]|nr:hypothetical protein [Oxalobacteraceae bacterium]